MRVRAGGGKWTRSKLLLIFFLQACSLLTANVVYSDSLNIFNWERYSINQSIILWEAQYNKIYIRDIFSASHNANKMKVLRDLKINYTQNLSQRAILIRDNRNYKVNAVCMKLSFFMMLLITHQHFIFLICHCLLAGIPTSTVYKLLIMNFLHGVNIWMQIL